MFRSATVKLTAIYVGILMVICLMFSVLLYRVLAHEFARNYTVQTDFFAGRPRLENLARDPEALQFLDQQVDKGKQRILLELLYINFSLLLTGGIASYFLARKTLKPIEEAHDAQARFTADASHELRTPLATMQTEIEVALRDPKLNLKQSKELLGSNLEEVSTLRQLTTGLLTLARGIDRGITRQSTNVNDAVTDALLRTQKSAEKRDVAISTKLVKKIQANIDRTHLTEVLVILLDNAVKYSAPKQVVELSAVRKNDTVIISIIDHGIGISAQNMEHIFERFYRADNARTQSGQNGHGLGLAIAKQLIEQYGGNIEVISEEGVGTTVNVAVPAA